MKKKLSNHVIVRTGNLIVAGVLLAILSSTTSLAQETGKEAAKDKMVATETTAAAEKTAATETPVAKAKTGTKGKQAVKEKDVVQEPVWSDYEVILDRNMFSKFRKKPFDPKDEPVVRPDVPKNLESFYILRGVANESGVFKACLQDNKRMGVLWVVVGDAVARGKIAAIPNLDSIEYQMEGETTTRTVYMGYDLEGGRGKIDVRDVPSMMGGGGRPDRGGDMGFGGGNMRMNDMRSRSQSGFDTGFGRRGGGRDRMNMGGMGMRGMDMQPQTTSASSSSSSDTTLSGSDAEILRKMMERRAAEMGQAMPASDPNQEQPGQ
jgi:hypothetical protein